MIQNTFVEFLESLCTTAALRRASRRLSQLYDDALEPSGLRITQFGLLSQIVRLQQPTLRALAEDLVMDLSALSHTLKPLIRDGLVELEVDRRDRRAKRVGLTAEGERRFARGLELWETVNGRLDAALEPEAAQQLRRTLDWLASEEFVRRFAQIGPAHQEEETHEHPRQ